MARTGSKSAGGIDYQIPRNVLALLMLAQVVVVLPHVAQLSPWIVGVCLFCGYWRAMVYQGRWAYPPGFVKALLVMAAFTGAAVSGKGVFSVETASSLLVLAFALKLIEMKTRRDAYLVIFLSYFVIATEFLFSQSMGVAVYEVLACVMVTAAMIGLNQLQSNVRPVASLRLAGALLGQALPLTLVLFLFFPRIAPLWNVPLPSGATSGISDRVTPGDIADLAQSDEIAFRVVFDGEVPQPEDMYWRGVVYNEFAGGTWSEGKPGRRARPTTLVPPEQRTAGLSYRVLQEPTFASYLFALATPVVQSNQIELRPNFTLLADKPLMSMMHYDVTSYPEFRREVGLERPRLTGTLPEFDNPRVREWAQRVNREAGSPGEFSKRILEEIRSRFVYTLQPPKLPRNNSIDAFWFDTRTGFCSHFAGAFVYMMRAAGYEARMVGGYQGGEQNPISGHVVVRQYDAHAWAEVWTEGTGWLRVDPTGAVAPERIRRGLNAALSEEDRSSLSAFTNARLGGYGGIDELMYMFDSVQHSWNMWVVGYDGDLQMEYLTGLFGKRPSAAQIGAVILLGGMGSLAIAGLVLFLRRPTRRRDPLVNAFLRFSAAAEARGQVREAWESPMAFVRRVSIHQALPQDEVDAAITGLEEQLYARHSAAAGGEGRGHDSAAARKSLLRTLRRLRWRTSLRV